MIRTQLGLLSLAFLISMAFQTYELLSGLGNLGTMRDAQQSSVDQGQRLRAQLDLLASGTARLAAGGDAGAQAVIAQLQRDGITVKAP